VHKYRCNSYSYRVITTTGVGPASASATCVCSSPKLELKLNVYVNQCVCYNASIVYISQLQGQHFCWSSHCFLTLFWNSLHAMEHKNSSVFTTARHLSFPEPHKSSSLLPNPMYLRPILILSFPSTLKAAEWSLSLGFRHHNTCYMRRPSHTPWPHLPNNIWRAVSFITLFSPLSSYWTPLGPKSPPRHTLNLRSLSPLQTKFHTHKTRDSVTFWKLQS